MNFYIVKHEEYGKTKTLMDKNTFTKHVCGSCGGIHLQREGLLRIKIQGLKPANHYMVPQYHVIDDKFIKVLVENNFTGFTLSPVVITETQLPQSHISTLRELVIFGKGGFMHDLQGNELEKCKECNKVPIKIKDVVNGLSVNQDQWDGSDIFYYNNWFGSPVVTQKVMNKLLENKIKNLKFVHVNDYIFNYNFKEMKKFYETKND